MVGTPRAAAALADLGAPGKDHGMTPMEIARRWTVLFLAEVLKTSVRAIEAVLPYQPRWLAQIDLLAKRLHNSVDISGSDETAPAPPARDETFSRADLDSLLASHAVLHHALITFEARGLALDEDLVQRMRDDWNAESVIQFLQSAETQLRETAATVLDQSAAPLGNSVAALLPVRKHRVKVSAGQ